MKKSLPTIINGLKCWVSDIVKKSETELRRKIDNLPKQKQADWNQNDKTALDFVKNRPFYKDTEKIVLFEAVKVRTDGGGRYYFDSQIKIIVGQPYGVEIDGVTYEVVADVVNGYSRLSIPEKGDIFEDGIYMYLNGVPVKIYRNGIIHKIDEQYIPTSIARTSEIMYTFEVEKNEYGKWIYKTGYLGEVRANINAGKNIRMIASNHVCHLISLYPMKFFYCDETSINIFTLNETNVSIDHTSISLTSG